MWKFRVKEISFILIGAIFFWIVDTIMDELLFKKRSFADALFFNIPHLDIYMRLTTMAAIIVFGLVIVRYSNMTRRVLLLAGKPAFDTILFTDAEPTGHGFIELQAKTL